MPPDPTSRPESPAQILALLGITGNGAGASTVEAVRGATRKLLLDCAHRLQLAGAAALSKEELVSRVARALESASASAGAAFPPKFDLGPDAEIEPMPQNIPWGYGLDRVTAMPVDPERLYVYWEVTDDALATARAGLGPAGASAWLNLRVYDISGRLFDGTNAHSYFDHRLERHDRQWFFEINKPTSSACAEVGLLSEEGYFVKIARSGRVDFPRREPAPAGPVEWLSVRTGFGGGPNIVGSSAWPASGDSAGPGQAAGAGPAGGQTGQGGQGGDGQHGIATENWTEFAGFPTPGGHRVFARRWQWEAAAGVAWSSEIGKTEWSGPVLRTEWEAGPFVYPVEVPSSVELRDTGEMSVLTEGGRTHVVYGPWQVVIRGIGARAERRVLATWELRRKIAVTGGIERVWSSEGGFAPGSSEWLLGGASERAWRGSSELHARGGSELWMLGASELRLRGASEVMFQGASEYRFRGASEQSFTGSSERLLRGASERTFAGSSERRLGGASERGLGGASERGLGGASERVAAGADLQAITTEPSEPSLYPDRKAP